MQFALGWDWIQATPDRNTGPWDAVVAEATGTVVLEHPVVTTRALRGVDAASGGADAATLSFEVTLRNTAAVAERVELRVRSRRRAARRRRRRGRRAESAGAARARVRARARGRRGAHGLVGGRDARARVAVVAAHARRAVPVRLPLRGARRARRPPRRRRGARARARARALRVGVRLAEGYVDATARGRAFRVNGVPMFLAGGNWIASDQLLRYATDARRYRDELALHRAAGLDLVRVWGGGLAERPEFYDAADGLGLLVMQEFWMSGDNNGRWAGEYAWPLDHAAYLDNARDTVRALRAHASLLFWCGGNELDPPGRNPSPDVAAGLRAILAEDDPTRTFQPSSMDGGNLGGDESKHHPEWGLTPKDGPYSFLLAPTYYDVNPGLDPNLTVAFQPEVGASSAPAFASLRRFLNASSLDAFPTDGRRNGSVAVGASWDFHRFEGYVTAYEAPARDATAGATDRVLRPRLRVRRAARRGRVVRARGARAARAVPGALRGLPLAARRALHRGRHVEDAVAVAEPARLPLRQLPRADGRPRGRRRRARRARPRLPRARRRRRRRPARAPREPRRARGRRGPRGRGRRVRRERRAARERVARADRAARRARRHALRRARALAGGERRAGRGALLARAPRRRRGGRPRRGVDGDPPSSSRPTWYWLTDPASGPAPDYAPLGAMRDDGPFAAAERARRRERARRGERARDRRARGRGRLARAALLPDRDAALRARRRPRRGRARAADVDRRRRRRRAAGGRADAHRAAIRARAEAARALESSRASRSPRRAPFASRSAPRPARGGVVARGQNQ